LSTRETVLTLTPQELAISLIVTDASPKVPGFLEISFWKRSW
jgi:hypothetical protein